MNLLPALGPSLRPSLGLAINRGALPGSIVAPPTGFDYVPPVPVRRAGSTFRTSFNAADWKVAATADVWVSPTGSDTTGTGTQGLPYRTIKKGLAAAAVLSDASVNLYIQAGIYNRNQHWNVTACDKNLNVIAVGGTVVSSCRYEPLTWTLDTGGTYKTTRSSVATVWDENFPVSYTMKDGTIKTAASKLVKQATQAACEAAPGSWYTDGTTLYVHTQDGRVPDSALLVMANIGNLSFAGSHRWYLENIVFEGATLHPFACASSSVTAAASLVLNGVSARCSADAGNAFAFTGVPMIVSYQCAAYATGADGFNYHIGSNGIDCCAMEIGCVAYANGTPGSTNNFNGSTSHENSRVVRVAGQYGTGYGPNVADVNTAKSWNAGCSASGSSTASSDSQDSGFQALDTAEQWLDTCTATGSHYAAYAVGTIHTRNCTLTGAISGNVTAY